MGKLSRMTEGGLSDGALFWCPGRSALPQSRVRSVGLKTDVLELAIQDLVVSQTAGQARCSRSPGAVKPFAYRETGRGRRRVRYRRQARQRSLIDRATGSLLRALSRLSRLSLAMWFDLSVRQTRQRQHRCMEHPPSHPQLHPMTTGDPEHERKSPQSNLFSFWVPTIAKAFVLPPDEAPTWSSHRGSREPRSPGPSQGRRPHSPPLLTPRIRFSGTPLVQEEPL